MTDQKRDSRIDQFILEQIDSVTHLEALLLIWNSRPKVWSAEDMGKVLYVRNEFATKILDGLSQRGLIATPASGTYTALVADEERTTLLEEVDAAYRRELVRISSMIHSKAPAGVRDFARAFRFTKDKE
jgi:hypothetical protein